MVWENNPSPCGYCISPSMVLWCGKTIRVSVDTALVRAWYLWCGENNPNSLGVRWSEFRCWNHVESSWGSKTFLWFFRFPEFLDCRSHELAYRAHSTFRPVHPEQGLNNTTYLFLQKSRVHQQDATILCYFGFNSSGSTFRQKEDTCVPP